MNEISFKEQRIII